MFLRITLVILSLLLVACSAPARKPHEQAIYQTLVEEVTFRKLTELCNNVSNKTEQQVWRAKKEWWKRNGVFVEAADFGFSYNLITLTGTRQETGARYAMALSYDIVNEAENRTKASIEDGVTETTCLEVMTNYRDGKMDLSEDKDRYALLLTLMQQKESQGEDLQLKQAELELQKGRTYSRSSITAKNMAQRTICPDAKILTLKSKWPLEIFEASCPDKSYTLIECEWGHCKSK